MASFYTRGFHLGRQLLSPSHSHFQSGPVYSLWQAGTSLGQPATDDEKRLGTIKTTAPAGTISSAPWGLASKAQAKLVNNGPSQASLASAFPSRLSSPAGPGSSAVVRPETKDPLANMGLDMLDSVAGPFDPFREEVSGVVDMAVVGAMTGNHGLAKPTLAVLPSPPTTPSSSPTPPVTRQQHQPQPNVHLRDHSELIKQLGKEGGWERVKNLWEELQRKGVQVDLGLFFFLHLSFRTSTNPRILLIARLLASLAQQHETPTSSISADTPPASPSPAPSSSPSPPPPETSQHTT